MKLIEACNALFKKEYEQHPVFVFVYKTEYPILFFSSIVQRLNSSEKIICQNIAHMDSNISEIENLLRTTFLGQQHTFWFGDLVNLELSDKDKAKLLQIIGTYKGPHRCIIVLNEKDLPKSFSKELSIMIDEELHTEDKIKLVQFLYPSLALEGIKKMTYGFKKLSLDNYILLAQYGMVLGKNIQIFIKDLLNKIITPESSLFLLAQYFFGRKKNEFWKMWNEIKNEYPMTFWTVFWSEQIWRAYYVIVMQQQNNIIEARSMAYRLPFSFLQKESKILSLQDLASAHAMIYDIEWRIKNGGSDLYFDFLFHSFLNKKST